MTSSSSSKTEFTRIFYDVFDVGGYAGSSRLEVSLAVLMLLVILFPTSLSLLNSELICRSYGSFGFLAVVPRPERQYRLSPQAVVPLSKAVVPPMAISGSTAPVPRWYRLDSRRGFLVSGSADVGAAVGAVVPLVSGSTAGVRGSTAYKRYYRPKVHVWLLLFPASSARAVVPLVER